MAASASAAVAAATGMVSAARERRHPLPTRANPTMTRMTNTRLKPAIRPPSRLPTRQMTATAKTARPAHAAHAERVAAGDTVPAHKEQNGEDASRGQVGQDG